MVSPVIIPKRKRNNNNTSKKKRGLIVILFIFILAIFYFLFFMNSDSTPKYMEGSWVRSDGPYTIEISEIKAEGKLLAKQFNRNPINVGDASWKEYDGKVQIYVELRDTNYPGSNYKLTYIEKTETLFGTYFQAVASETFEVSFKKIK